MKITCNEIRKKIPILILVFACISCSDYPKQNYLSIAGEIKNNSSSVLIVKNQDYNKEITIDKNGFFKDTLHLKNVENKPDYSKNIFRVSTEKSSIFCYLKNGYDLNINVDENDFNKSIDVSGKGSKSTNYLIEKISASNALMNIESYFNLNREAYLQKVDEIMFLFNELLHRYDNIDHELFSAEKENNELLRKNLLIAYENHKQTNTLKKGTPSPTFKDFINYHGGTSSLEDLKGSYLYIDIWATWCGPCIQQIPYLNALEHKYKNQNIKFVSISIDDDRVFERWKSMIREKNMGGIQLFSRNNPAFSKNYQITGIPRFILLDPKGNIVDADAPRPSDPNITALFTSLGM